MSSVNIERVFLASCNDEQIVSRYNVPLIPVFIAWLIYHRCSFVARNDNSRSLEGQKAKWTSWFGTSRHTSTHPGRLEVRRGSPGKTWLHLAPPTALQLWLCWSVREGINWASFQLNSCEVITREERPPTLGGYDLFLTGFWIIPLP